MSVIPYTYILVQIFSFDYVSRPKQRAMCSGLVPQSTSSQPLVSSSLVLTLDTRDRVSVDTSNRGASQGADVLPDLNDSNHLNGNNNRVPTDASNDVC